jgi:hypothetical protein
LAFYDSRLSVVFLAKRFDAAVRLHNWFIDNTRVGFFANADAVAPAFAPRQHPTRSTVIDALARSAQIRAIGPMPDATSGSNGLVGAGSEADRTRDARTIAAAAIRGVPIVVDSA